MKSVIFLVISIFIVSACFAQVDTSTLLKIENCNNLNLTNDSAYNFSFLKNVLKNKQYIFLGENEHGDGETLIAKAKMIKYLHDTLNFDALVLEYGMYKVAKGWNNINTKKDSGVGVLGCIKYVFCDSKGEDDIILGKYLDECVNANPLVLAGLAINSGSSYEKDFCDTLKSFLKKLNYDFNDWKTLRPFLDFKEYFSSNVAFETQKEIDDYKLRKNKHQVQAAGDSLINFIRKAMVAKMDSVDTLTCKYFIRFIECEKAYDKYSTIQAIHGTYFMKYFSYRDTVMAENLTFLLNEVFKDKKVIISIATSHATKDIQQFYGFDSLNGFWNMMMGLDSEILAKSYVLPFIRYEGSSGRPGTVFEFGGPFASTSKNSIEYLLSKKYDYCFLDCKENNDFKDYLESKEISPTFDGNYKLKWFSMYDGLFFIKHMKPVEISYMLKRTGKKF